MSISKLPLPSEVTVSASVLSTYNFTWVFGDTVPVKEGVVSLVILSEFEGPKSVSAFKVGIVGAWGVVWMVTFTGGELPEKFPIAFSVLTVKT